MGVQQIRKEEKRSALAAGRAGGFLICLVGFLTCFAPAGFAANDLLTIGMGPRAIGMGRAGVALSQAEKSPFINPAGLAGVKRFGLQSMYTNILDDVVYNTVSSAIPTRFGNVGVGFLRAGVGGILQTSADPSTGRGKIDGSFDYANNLLVLSYGGRLFEDALQVGTSLKYNHQDFSGVDSVTSYNMDLGGRYQLSPLVTVGAFQTNFLPRRWVGGDEGLERVTKVGVGYQATERLLGAFDLQWEQQRPVTTFHTGLEWQASTNLVLRGGVDQVAKSPSEQLINLTAGLGLTFDDFTFEYAYYRDNDPDKEASQSGAHYFAVGYRSPVRTASLVAEVPEEETVAEPVPVGPFFTVTGPQDKYRTYQETVVLSGTAKPGVTLYINAEPVVVDADGAYQHTVALDLGKNLIVVEGFDDGVRQEQTVRVLCVKHFADLPEDHWAKYTIEHLGTLGVFDGVEEHRFAPYQDITRAEYVAALHVVTREFAVTPPALKAPYRDVPLSHWAVDIIGYMKDHKLVSGYPDGTFRPKRLVTQAEGMAFVSRYLGVNKAKETKRPALPKLKQDHWAYDEMVSMWESRDFFRKGARFVYDQPINRAEAAAQIGQTRQAQDQMVALLDWETGYVAKAKIGDVRLTASDTEVE